MAAAVICVVSILNIRCFAEDFCFQEAGQTFGVAPQILWAIAKSGSDLNPQIIHHNINGSYDYGVMLINSGWYNTLGHDVWMSLSNPCLNIKTGAWILSQCIQKHGNIWEAVACYYSHSHNKKDAFAKKVHDAIIINDTATYKVQNIASSCFDSAAATYNIAPEVLRAIAHVESGGNPVAVNWNGNGTYDYGVMQINSTWYPALGKERWSLLGDPCFNINVGAWILSQCIRKYGYSWMAVGCYNAGSIDKRSAYAHKVANALKILPTLTAQQ